MIKVKRLAAKTEKEKNEIGVIAGFVVMGHRVKAVILWPTGMMSQEDLLAIQACDGEELNEVIEASAVEEVEDDDEV